MSLFETYLGNVENVEKMNPGAVMINVTRSAGSVLSPSWGLLNDYKAKRISWDGYIGRLVREMENPSSKAEMKRIGKLARTRDVYLVCYERKGNCHRFLLVDMIKKLLLEEECNKLNRLVNERPDIVAKASDNIAKALRYVEA